MPATDRRPPFHFSYRTRVGFDETDAQGIVYYGRYMPYFDRRGSSTCGSWGCWCASPATRSLRDCNARPFVTTAIRNPAARSRCRSATHESLGGTVNPG